MKPMPVEDLSGPGLRTFYRIARRWRLTEEAYVLLGRPDAAALRRWQEGQTADGPADVLLRISYVLGIHKAL